MVESTENKILYKIGSSPVFAFPYRFISPGDICCYLSQEDGSDRRLLASEFEVETKDDYSNGANITLLLDPLPAGATFAIVRECSPVQGVSFPTNGKFPSTSNENALDRLTMICQDLYSRIGRAPLIPVTASDSSENKRWIELMDIYSLLVELQNNVSLLKLAQEKLEKDNVSFRALLDSSMTTLAEFINGFRLSNGSMISPAMLSQSYEKLLNLNTRDGKLLWNNCEVYHACNHGEAKGRIECRIIPRMVSATTAPFDYRIQESSSGKVDADQVCLADVFVTSITYCNSIPDLGANDYSRASTDYYGGPLAFNIGEVIDRQDETSGEYYNACEFIEQYQYHYNCEESDAHVGYIDDAIFEINHDLQELINGSLLPSISADKNPYPFPTDELRWTGYKNWSLNRNFYGDPLYDNLEENTVIEVNTTAETSWYQIWHELPSQGEPVTTTVGLQCVVFNWIPDDDPENSHTPTSIILEDESGNEIICKLGVEYCLQEKNDIPMEDLIYTACDNQCRFIVPKRVVNADYVDGLLNIKTSTTSTRKFTFKGVNR